MKKFLGILLVVAICTTALSAICFPSMVGAVENVFSASFDDGSSDGWTNFNGGAFEISTEEAHSGTKSLKVTEHERTWHSPAYNLYAAMKEAGEGLYTLHAWIYTDEDDIPGATILMRGESVATMPSFMQDNGGNAFTGSTPKNVPQSTWTELTLDFIMTAEDVEAESNTFNFCIDGFPEGYEYYLDDVTVTVQEAPTPRPGQPAYKFTMAPNYVAGGDTYVMLEPAKDDIIIGTTAKLNVKNVGENAITVYLSIRNNDDTWSHAVDSEKVIIQPGQIGVLSIASIPEGGVHPVLELDTVAANDCFIIGNFTQWDLSFGTSTGILVPENIDGTGIFEAPAATQATNNENTADAATISYAIAAISGMAALAAAKKRYKK